MALSETLKLDVISSASHGTGAYTPASYTGTNNALQIVEVYASGEDNDALAGADVTLSGGGLTWTQVVVSTTHPGYGYGIRVFRATGNGGSIALSADAGTFNVHRYRIRAYEYTGHDTSTPIGATGVNSDADGDAAASVTLSGTPAATSKVRGCLLVALSAGSGGVTPGADFTEDFEDAGSETAWQVFQSQSRTGPATAATTVDWVDLNSAGGGQSAGAAMVAYEVKEAAGGGGGTVNTKTVTDTVSISDRLLSSALHNRLTADGVTVADTLVKSVITSNIRNKTASDAIIVSDALSKRMNLTRTLGDVIVVSEPGVDLQYLYNLSVTDTVDLTDAMTRTLKRTRQIGDSVTITDTVAATTSSSRVVAVTQADSIVLADSVIRSVQRTRQIADSIAANDSLLRALSLTRQNIDIITLVDSQLKVRRYNATVSDFVDVSDSVSALILGAVIYDVQIEIGVDMDPIIGVES